MKKFILILLFLSLAFCRATHSFAFENNTAQSHDFKLQHASKALQISGEVRAVNESAGTISLTKKFKDKTIEVMAVTDTETIITKGKEIKSIQDIKAGDKVIVVYTKNGAVNLAKSITLK